MKLSIKDFFSKYDEIRRKLRIWSPLLKKSWMENFIFCAVILNANPSFIMTKMRKEPNQNTMSQGWYKSKYIMMTRHCLHLCKNLNIQKIEVSLPSLQYLATALKTSQQFCSLFPSSTIMLFTTRRNELEICTHS